MEVRYAFRRKRVSIKNEEWEGEVTMHSVRLGLASRISMIFSAASGSSTITFLYLAHKLQWVVCLIYQ